MRWFPRVFSRSPDVALFVDGPNVLRMEFDVDLADLRNAAADKGPLRLCRLYLNDNASSGLIQAGEANGFDVRVTSGDVDVKMAVDATAAIFTADIDLLAIASRDTDFKPVVELANEAGIETLAIAPGTHGRSDALRNAAHDAILLGE